MLGMGIALTGHADSYRKRGNISNNSGAEKELLAKIQAGCRAHSKQLRAEGQKGPAAQGKLSPATFPSVD